MTSARSLPALLLMVCLNLTDVVAEPAPQILAMPSVLRFGIAEACPHMCPDSLHKGFTHDITLAIFSQLGYQIEFVSLPWARAAVDALNGRLDGVLSAGQSEVPGMIFPSQELATQRDCFFGRSSDTWQPDDAQSFVGRRTIVFKGWVKEQSFLQTLGKEQYRVTFEELPIDEHYYTRVETMVLAGRAHAFWMDENVYDYIRRTTGRYRDGVKNLGCIEFQKLYLALTPQKMTQSTRLAQEFDEGMIHLRESGELARILNVYGLQDWNRSGNQ